MENNVIENAFKDVLGVKKIHDAEILPPNALSQSRIYKTDQGDFFVKIYDLPDVWMFEAEFKALQIIEQTATLRVPKPYYYGKNENMCFLIMEYIELSGHIPSSQEKLGHQLAKMHLTKFARSFGFEMNNTIGLTTQINNWTKNWVTFFIHYRLEFQLRVVEKNYEDYELVSLGIKFIEKFPQFFEGLKVLPSLLHGDLWSGNTAKNLEGNPVVYDPSSYYGHHEAELSILQMFGGFNKDFFDGYRELIPCDDGFEERQWGYQLYHYLNHYNLFGDSYRPACMSLLRKLA